MSSRHNVAFQKVLPFLPFNTDCSGFKSLLIFVGDVLCFTTNAGMDRSDEFQCVEGLASIVTEIFWLSNYRSVSYAMILSKCPEHFGTCFQL
jgi:hypothetical protein